MAEFLVFNKDNWMDAPAVQNASKTGYEAVQDAIANDSSLSAIDKTKEQAFTTKNYNCRNLLGDIVESREDGKGFMGKKEPLSYALIEVPEIPFEDSKHYSGSLHFEGFGLLYKCKYSLDLDKIILDKDNIATLTKAQFDSYLTEKT